MTKYNRIVRTTDFTDEFAPQIALLKKYGYGDLNYDALWKWAGIMQVVKDFKLEASKSCIDIGGGCSPLHILFSAHTKVYNNDINFNNWFPIDVETKCILPPGEPMPRKQENIVYVGANFYDFIKTLEEGTVDFCYDGCSVIHFNEGRHTHSHNDAANEVAAAVKRMLRPGGMYISCCDVLHPSYKPLHEPWQSYGTEFNFAENIFDDILKTGLVPVDEPDYVMEPFFDDLTHSCLTIAPGDHRQWTPPFSKRNHLPEYHAFAQEHTDFTREVFTSARFVFKKV